MSQSCLADQEMLQGGRGVVADVDARVAGASEPAGGSELLLERIGRRLQEDGKPHLLQAAAGAEEVRQQRHAEFRQRRLVEHERRERGEAQRGESPETDVAELLAVL